MRHSRVVSASSSFFRFIRSLSASASRRAICIFCCMDSAFASAMGSVQYPQRQCQSQSGDKLRETAIVSESQRCCQRHQQAALLFESDVCVRGCDSGERCRRIDEFAAGGRSSVQGRCFRRCQMSSRQALLAAKNGFKKRYR